MSQLSGSAARTLRTVVVKPAPVVAVKPAPALAPVALPIPPEEPREINVIGPRKLIRPTLPAGAMRDRRFERRDEPALSWHASAAAAASVQESSHAESFYFQKQMQAQTPMVFVLEDGEKIEGCIEWYDRNAIKVRCTHRAAGTRPGDGIPRVLIYKAGIKYLFKAGENQPLL
jgi:hypothetical protein